MKAKLTQEQVDKLHIPSQKFLDGMAPNEALPGEIIDAIEDMNTFAYAAEKYAKAEKKIKEYINEHWGSIDKAEYEIAIRTKNVTLVAQQDRVKYKTSIVQNKSDNTIEFETPEESEED